MTITTCLVDITRDARLMKKVQENWFCDDEKGGAPVLFPRTNKGHYWTIVLPDWCATQGIPVEKVSSLPFQVRARLKREQILAFVSHLYDDDESYTDPEKMLTWKGQAYLAIPLLNFRAFLAQNLARGRYYDVVATEEIT